MEQQPYVGLMVHYVNRGTADGAFLSVCRAAVVTRVDQGSIVSLQIFNPHGTSFEHGVLLDLSGSPHSWHFIGQQEACYA